MRRRLGTVGSRGVSLVAYALVLVLFVLILVPVIRVLTDAGEAEVDNQSDCVSTRPPPEDCRVRVVTTTSAP